MQCDGGIVMMDMKMFIPAAQQEQMGNYRQQVRLPISNTLPA